MVAAFFVEFAVRRGHNTTLVPATLPSTLLAPPISMLRHVFFCNLNNSMLDVTQILSAIEAGDSTASGRLLPLLYDELRKLAAQKLANERPSQTLQATALVHEAYLRLVDVEQVQHWNSRGHFFAAAAEAMRRILVDRARRKNTAKHGGDWVRIDVPDIESTTDSKSDNLLALDEALTKLAAEEPAKAELVKLRYFAGLSIEEAADVLGISRTTASRYWTYARIWLFSELSDDEADSEE
jgi:RNA polymerase sigma factor (TIGR02999 family)